METLHLNSHPFLEAFDVEKAYNSHAALLYDWNGRCRGSFSLWGSGKPGFHFAVDPFMSSFSYSDDEIYDEKPR